MPGYEGMTRIDPESPVYQEVERLYRIAHEVRPGGLDRWNGELYSRTDDKYGGLTRDGTLRLNERLVLDQLTGGEGTDNPVWQGQALATVLHESLHARVEMDAKNEPNALRAPHSIGLDEGLTELATMEDYDEFVRRAGYENTQMPNPEYPGAVHAAGELLDRASSSGAERSELLNKALDQPVMMRWDTIADNIVKNELADAVPPDAEHQQAARAHIVNQMAVGEWAVVHDLDGLGPTTAELTNEAVDNGVAQIREHYQNTPDEPFPARTPNPAAEVTAQAAQQPEQQRAITTLDRDQPVDLANLPPPDASTRIPDAQPTQPATRAGDQPTPTDRAEGADPSRSDSPQTIAQERNQPTPSGQGNGVQPSNAQPAPNGHAEDAQPATRAAGQQGDPMRFLNNQAPAAHATRPGPSLGDGSRGAGAPAGPSVNRPTPSRTPDRGGRD
jgi:hypothetical protein